MGACIKRLSFPTKTSTRIDQLAGHYLQKKDQYKAIETRVTLFEDINSLDRSSVLNSLETFVNNANRELIDLRPLLSKARYQNYASFVRQLEIGAISGGSCSAVAKRDYSLRSISRNGTGPIPEFHKKLAAALKLAGALKNLNTNENLSLTQTLQSYKPGSHTQRAIDDLKAPLEQVQFSSNYTNRRG